MSDRWLVLAVRVPSDEWLEALAEGLLALGGSAVQEEAGRLLTYLPAPSDPDALATAATERLGGLIGERPAVEWWWREDEDWSRRWREGLAPRRIGRRLVVTQPWNPVKDPGALVVVIDPATAFGTGEHATTRGSLRLLEQAVERGQRVLDVGTGSGILAIAAAALGAGSVVAVESDGTAIGNARENLDRSGRGDRVRLVNASVDPGWLAANGAGGYDGIVANVLSGVLVPLLSSFALALRPGGWAILGGILDSEAEVVLAAATEAGFALSAEDREEGWWTSFLRRPA